LEDLAYIIVRCLAQDKNYQRKFYERYFSFAMKCAFRYFNHIDPAKDIVLDSFVKVFNGLPGFLQDKVAATLPEGRLLAWIKTIVINTCIDHFRRNKRAPELVDITPDIWNDQADDVSADTNVLYKELLFELSNLSPSYRMVFNLHAVDGYTFKEIGTMLGLTTGGVKAAYFKAKLALQKKLTANSTIAQAYVKS